MYNALVAMTITAGFMGFLGAAYFVFEWVRFIGSTMLEERRQRR